MRSRCTFRVILHREDAVGFTFDSLDCIIQYIYMGNLKGGVFQGIRVNGIIMVLTRDFKFSGLEILNRMIATSVTKF